jgi:hypothetical protein
VKTLKTRQLVIVYYTNLFVSPVLRVLIIKWQGQARTYRQRVVT